MARKRRETQVSAAAQQGAAARPGAAQQGTAANETKRSARAVKGRILESSSPFGKYLWWFLISLVALIVLPNMYAGTFVPKMFWALTTIGLAWIFLPPRRPAELIVTPLALIWFAYLAWALISLTWAIQPRIGFERWAILAVWTCGYVVALRTRFWESMQFWVLFQWLFIVICMIGILQFLFPDLPFLTWIPASGLPSSTMGHRNYACMYLSITLPFLGWLFFVSHEWKSRVLPAAAFLMGLAFLIFTRAREAWIAAMVSLIFMMICGGWSKLRSNHGFNRRWALVAVLVFLPLLFIGPASNVLQHGWRAMPEEKKNIFSTIIHPFKRKGDPRLEMWVPALKMMNPATGSWVVLHGYGFGNFPIASTPMESHVRTLDYEIHNDYLQALVDLGLPGMLLFTGFFLYLLWLAWKGRARGLIIAAGGAVVGLAVVQFFTFTSENISPIVWIVGVIAILNSQGTGRPIWKAQLPAWLSQFGHWATALFLVAFCVIVGIAISAEKRIYAEAELSSQPDLDRLAHQELPRMRFNSNIAFIKAHSLADTAIQAQMPKAAEAFARHALYLHPNDWGSMQILASLVAAKGQMEEAIHLLERAAVISNQSPDPRIWQDLQAIYTGSGKKDLAEKAGKAAAAKLVKEPVNLTPANGTTGIAGPLEFSWKGSPNAEKYDIYLWKEGDPFPNMPQVYHVKKTRAKLDLKLQPNTTYMWLVKALGPTGKLEGEHWKFTTGE